MKDITGDVTELVNTIEDIRVNVQILTCRAK